MLIISRYLSLFSKYDTLTKMNLHIAIKLFIFRFLNSTLVYLYNNLNEDYFSTDSLVDDQTILII